MPDMITTQLSFIDRNTAETWTVTHEFHTLHDVTDYLLQRPPDNLAIRDTYLVDVKISDGVNLYFKGYQGAWELINRSDYEHTWTYEYKQAVEAKQRYDHIKDQGGIKPAPGISDKDRRKLLQSREKARQSRQDRYLVR